VNRDAKIRALLATARVANVPSVVSNVFLGGVIGVFASDAAFVVLSLREVLAPCLAGVLLYVAGNFLNDWADRDWDARRRPERALPRGMFRPLHYALAAALLGIAGVAVAGWARPACGVVAAGIAVFIVIYTIWHKRGAWSVIPMGLCRALLPVMGCMAFFPYIDRVWPAATGIFCYIAGLSLSARHESMAAPPRGSGVVSRGLLLAAALLLAWQTRDFFVSRWLAVAGAVPYLAWTSFCLRFRRRSVPALVSGLLAGIPLVDWIVLLPAGLGIGGALSGDPLGIVCVAAPPVAMALALLLQRVAPAT
jgi:4-hydroxybenzoate polyprenyltransferase